MNFKSNFKNLWVIIVASFVVLAAGTTAWGQIVLGTSPYTETLDGVGAGLPSGYTVRTGATAASLGTTAAFTTAATPWATTSIFANMASSEGLTDTASTAQQSASTDRVIGFRQTGSFGDPGAAIVLQIANTTGLSNIDLSFKLQTLSSQPRTTTFTVDYGIGAAPTSFTGVQTVSTPTAFGSTTVTADFGAVLNNQTGPIFIRIAAIAASSGSGNRDTVGIDDVSITFDANAGNPTVNLSVSSNTGTETAQTAITVTATASAPVTGDQTVTVSTGGTATNGSDYVFSNPTVIQILNGQTTGTAIFTVADDAIAEVTETATLTITAVSAGISIGGTPAQTINIIDDDAVACTSLLINEALANPVTADDSTEFVELRGVPGGCVTPPNTFLVVFEGDGTPSGSVDLLINVSNQFLGTNGLLFIKAATGGFATPGGTTDLLDSRLNGGGRLENGSITFAVVVSSTAITEGVDYDTNNDGTFDVAPLTTATILDAVGYTDGDVGDVVYGAVLSQTSGTPDALTRFPGNNTPNNAASFFNADLVDGGANTNIAYDSTKASTNFPATGTANITPGATNSSPTAASVAVGGRVTESNGRGIARVRVTMTDSQGVIRTAFTNSFGFYQFENVAAGENYIFEAAHRRYRFGQPAQVRFIGGDDDSINFVSTEVDGLLNLAVPR